MSTTSWSPARQRAKRHRKEAERTRANLHTLLAADARVRRRGPDHIVTDLSADVGFERHDLIIVRIAIERRSITLVIAPRRIWHRQEQRERLLLLKQFSRNVGRRVVLVPETVLRREPRRSNSLTVTAAARVAMSLSQRLRLSVAVLSCGGSVTLRDCLELLPEHEDPAGAVLAMVHARLLYLPLDQPITPESLVSTPGDGPLELTLEYPR
jgi:hypothetical protein